MITVRWTGSLVLGLRVRRVPPAAAPAAPGRPAAVKRPPARPGPPQHPSDAVRQAIIQRAAALRMLLSVEGGDYQRGYRDGARDALRDG